MTQVNHFIEHRVGQAFNLATQLPISRITPTFCFADA